MKDWYAVPEVAKMLCVSQHTARRLIDQRHIRALVVPGSGPGGRKIRRVRRDDLVRFAEENNIPIDLKTEGVE